MKPNEIQNRLSNLIYNLLDMQGHIPTGEMNDELREVRYSVKKLNLKLLDYLFDNKTTHI